MKEVMSAEPITVMIVDDHDMVRLGLRVAIEASDIFNLVAEAKDGLSALQFYKEFQPDITLMDLLMPDMDGLDTAQKIFEEFPDAKIIALTSFQEDQLIESAVSIGMKGYILKNVTMSDLEKMISNVYAGNVAFGSEAQQALIRLSRNPSKHHEFNLTTSEIGVLKLVVDGMSNREIAQELVISTSTAKKHVSNILSKMNASNRAEAAALAVRHELFKKQSN